MKHKTLIKILTGLLILAMVFLVFLSFRLRTALRYERAFFNVFETELNYQQFLLRRGIADVVDREFKRLSL